MNTWKKNREQGFTLIELLVVIAIIGVLSTLLLLTFSNARTKARDVKRISDLEQIRTALEIYFDTNGYYPQVPCGWDCNGYAVSSNAASWDALATELAPYLSNLPKDAINSPGCTPFVVGCYVYSYGNVGRFTQRVQYDLTTTLETVGHPLSCGNKAYKYYFNNIAECPPNNQAYEASP